MTTRAVQTAYQLKVGTGPNFEPVGEPFPRFYIAAAAVLVIGLTAFSLSQYQNRMTQIKVGFAISLSIAGTLVGIMMGGKHGDSILEPGIFGEYSIGFWSAFAALFANILSNRLIRKDENLVRSMDRIR